MSTPALQTTPPFASPPTSAPPAPPRPPAARLPGRRNDDILGLVWLHGSLEAAVFRRQTMGITWVCPVPVLTLDEFETVLDQALAELKFAGTEVFLILEHEQFVHQAEHAPAFSESAARAYLRGRVQRHEQENEPVLWVSQPTVSVRKESAFLLHMLPSAFYGRLNGMLLSRRLDLTRILPLSVPLQFMLDSFPTPKDQPVLIASEAGGAITVLIGQVGSPLFFARTMQATWAADSARIAVEINRSLLYAKQQFGVVVTELWLIGAGLEQAKAEVQARCGSGKAVSVRPVRSTDWLQAVAKLSPRHPVNLVAGYLGWKRRLRFLRRLTLAACWVALGLVSLDTWSRYYSAREDQRQLARLEAEAPAMNAERDRLTERNRVANDHQSFIRQVADERLLPVPAKFLSYVGHSLPADVTLTEFTSKWDDATKGWTFRLEGQIAADDETARDVLNAWQKNLLKSPLRARVYDGARAIVPVPIAGSQISSHQRFSLEGGLFEK